MAAIAAVISAMVFLGVTSRPMPWASASSSALVFAIVIAPFVVLAAFEASHKFIDESV
jgi:hypothetical protein